MADLEVDGFTIRLDLPVRVPEFTLRLAGVDARGISVDGKPLARVCTRGAFKSGTFYEEGACTLVAFDPSERGTTSIKVTPRG